MRFRNSAGDVELFDSLLLTAEPLYVNIADEEIRSSLHGRPRYAAVIII